MPELEIRSTRSVLTIESDEYLEALSGLVQALLRDLDALDTAVHLDAVEGVVAERLTAVPLEYRYQFKGKDGRRFFQSLLFDNGVKQTFDTFGGRWKEGEEFVFHRPIRAAVITLIRDFQLSKLTAKYF